MGWEIGIGKSVKVPQTRAHKKYPTYIHPPTVGMTYFITTFIPQIVNWIYPIIYIQKNVYFPTLHPTAPKIIPSDEYPTPTYIFNLHILTKLFTAYIQHKDIF